MERYYTEKERAFIKKHKKSAATNFAGKEAVAKALGRGFSGMDPNEIALLRDKNGAPYVLLTGGAKEVAEALGVTKIHISLTDTEEYASAYVIAVKEEG